MQERTYLDKHAMQIGEVVSGCYEVEEFVGEGAYGEVFRAKDTRAQPMRRVAIKVLRRRVGDEHAASRRFVAREIALLKRMQQVGGSANVVGIVEPQVGEHRGKMFIVLEFVDGRSLKEWLEEKQMVPVSDAMRIAVGMARGLSAIHAASGVHRDLKPSNVRLRNGREAVILDVGVARGLWDTETMTVTGGGPMTMRYASPEQLEGRRVEPASDIYAFGLILYEMLVGTVPLVGRTLGETLRRRTIERPVLVSDVRPDVPHSLARVITHCLEFEPTRRPSAPQVVKLLNGTVDPTPRLRWPGFVAALSIPLTLWGDVAIAMANMGCTPQGDKLLVVAYRNNGSRSARRLEFHRRCQQGSMAAPVIFEAPDVNTINMNVYPAREGTIGIATTTGESCHRYRVRLTATSSEATIVDELPCSWNSGFWWASIVGDADGDGKIDFISNRRARGTAEKPSIHEGWTLLAGTTEMPRLVKNSFTIDFERYRFAVAQRLGDVNRDGCADMVIASYPTGGASPTSVHLFAGNCAGQFAPVVGALGTTLPGHIATLPAPANAGDMADVDGDDLVDLVIGGDDDGDPGQFWILKGNGHGFAQPEEAFDVVPGVESGADEPGWANSCTLLDWNDDGHLDAVVNFSPGQVGTAKDLTRFVVFLGSGDGRFSQESLKVMDTPPNSMGFALPPWHEDVP